MPRTKKIIMTAEITAIINDDRDPDDACLGELLNDVEIVDLKGNEIGGVLGWTTTDVVLAEEDPNDVMNSSDDQNVA